MSSIYLKEASLEELLAEVNRRFEERGPVNEWAAPTVFAVAAYYGIHAADLRSRRRDDHLVKLRHLTIALLGRLHPGRSRAEVSAVLGLGHEMYAHALQKTDERTSRFPEFRSEVMEILKIIRETQDGDSHCRSARQVRRAPNAEAALCAQSDPAPR